MRLFVFVFIISFGLNAIWENLHAPLYVHYQGGTITEWILLRAALVDALILTILFLVTSPIKSRTGKYLVIIIAAVVIAVWIERWALASARWEYQPAMPIIPVLQTGLSPAIQLALMGSLVLYLNEKIKNQNGGIRFQRKL